jgi:hypothetical protein
MSISITRKVGLPALLATLGTLAFGATAANANQGDTTTCAFTGVAGGLNPPVAATGSEDGSYTFQSDVPGGMVTCIETDAANDAGPNDSATPGVPPTGTFSVIIRSDGYYTGFNAAGTGSVAGYAGVGAAPASSEIGIGTPPLGVLATPAQPCPPMPPFADTAGPFDYFGGGGTALPPGVAGKYTGVGYGIDFRGGVGTLGGGAVTPQNVAGDIPDALDVKGAVSITGLPVACGGSAIAAFTVAGSFVAL